MLCISLANPYFALPLSIATDIFKVGSQDETQLIMNIQNSFYTQPQIVHSRDGILQMTSTDLPAEAWLELPLQGEL